MVTKAERERANQRLAQTLDLFQPTAHQEQAADEAAAKAAQARVPKSRIYERQRPAFAFRIRPADNGRIDALARGLDVTKDALAAGLVQAALDAVEGGRLLLSVERQAVQRRDKLGRLRTWVRMTVRGEWTNPAK
ncbi:MAG: hypothetical protein JXA93_12385 [Anaerolineae bacterium]|nr:hypothetical protein [Anaerolineae bacterium]